MNKDKITEMIQAGAGPILRIDGQASTARRPMAHVTITDPDAPMQEYDTLMCMHCQAHWIVEPGSGRRRGWCNSCNGPTCGSESCATTCLHWEKMFEQIESQGRINRNVKALRR